MLNDFASMVGWYFLPGLVSGWLQTILYTVFIRVGDPKPAPGSPRFVRDGRYIRIFVVLSYLLYTIVEADYQLRQAGDFYQALDVPHDVDEKGLQSRFRRLTVQYHPDKASGSDRDAIETIYVHLKVARDTLVDPAKRFAYDRFGPDILDWQQCKVLKDYVLTGVRKVAVYYVGTASALVLASTFGYLRSGTTWRYLVLAAMFVMEMHVLTRPEFPALLTAIVNPVLVVTRLRQPYLPFQGLSLLKKLAITFFIALSQLERLLKPLAPQALTGDSVAPHELDRLDALTRATEQEVSRILGLELAQYGADPASGAVLRSTTKDWLVQNTIRNDAEVSSAMRTAFEKRRLEARDNELPPS